MKKILYLLLFVLLVVSCKKNKENPKPESFPTVITGKIYGSQFVTKVALHKYTNFYYDNFKPEDLFQIYLSADASKNCTNNVKEFSVRFSIPKKVGVYSNISFIANDPKDPNGTDGFLITSASSTVEITSITDNKVSGKATLIDDQLNTNTSIKGDFEAAICK